MQAALAKTLAVPPFSVKTNRHLVLQARRVQVCLGILQQLEREALVVEPAHLVEAQRSIVLLEALILEAASHLGNPNQHLEVEEGLPFSAQQAAMLAHQVSAPPSQILLVSLVLELP